MYLRPAQLPKGEKVLRIIDFVDNIIPREDERTISDGGHTKLIVSYGPKKPKLEQVTKLNSLEDIINYPAYTVKVMELSNRFQWPSVLKYDDEFRLLQATYGYPRSFDCNHLHTVTLLAERLCSQGNTVLLQPIPKTPTPTRSTSRVPGPSTQFAVTTSEGRTICHDFLVIGSTYRDCNEKYDALLVLLQDLGFSISWRKLVPPTQCLTFW
ncbi:unnamed protein product [Porites lobata]|uniref:Uncharacterized protein n=1 Tax=Porites lobata TaxID=104759 RepID=A0ABN8RZE2_9CNID|nr:unnamed protein product [Porites lobata]